MKLSVYHYVGLMNTSGKTDGGFILSMFNLPVFDVIFSFQPMIYTCNRPVFKSIFMMLDTGISQSPLQRIM